MSSSGVQTNRIADLFEKKKKGLLSVYFTAGFPSLESTVEIATLLEKSGADMIEIGIPFSDPVADGPVIQESNMIALKNEMTLKKLLEQIRVLRKNVRIPLVLMGYLNPVIQFGFESFCKEASGSGVDGLILPDLPLDEYDETYRSALENNGLGISFLVSPTTSEERILKIDSMVNGFIYAVSASSTTGAKGEFSADQVKYFEKLKNMKLRNPFLIGFGISNAETFKTATQFGAGAIIGSAFISMLKESKNLDKDIGEFVERIKG